MKGGNIHKQLPKTEKMNLFQKQIGASVVSDNDRRLWKAHKKVDKDRKSVLIQ